jgi:Ca-activated chloride channel family protein
LRDQHRKVSGGRRAWWLVIVAALTASVALDAQFASRVTLVEVYATVSDAEGRPMLGLPREAFRVTDGGIARDIEVFAASDFPLSVAVAIDRSWSMAGRRLDQARVAARLFLAELREQDEAMLIGISSEVQTLAPLSRDRAAQHAAVESLSPWGATKLHDAILEALARVEVAQGRRALVVLSDGEDRGSRATAEQVTERVRATPVIVYPVTIARRNSPLMTQMASFTGGRAFWLEEPDALEPAFRAIARELREQYLIGYVPPPDAASVGGWRRITVDVPGRAARVRARPGYVSGAVAAGGRGR